MGLGFTLIELSIVLVVIGLIVGGVLVGRDLIQAAAMRTVITEKEKFTTEAMAFRLKYNALPGDWANATNHVSGCASNGTNKCNGDGNGSVDGFVYGHYGETCRFWQHLSLTGYLKEYQLSFNNQNAGACTDVETPKAAYSKAASWFLFWGCRAGEGTCVNDRWPGVRTGGSHFALLRTGISVWGSRMSPSTDQAGIVNPRYAKAIDTKIDDGLPRSGTVISNNSLGSDSGSSAPYAAQKRYCVSNATGIWDYYMQHNSDDGGCRMLFAAGF